MSKKTSKKVKGTSDSPIMDDIEESQPAVDKEEIERIRVQRYYQRFLKAEQGVKPKHEVMKTLDTFDRGKQWEGTSIPPWVPKPVTNFIRYIRTIKRANLASGIPKPDFMPVAQDDADQVSKIAEAHDHVWETEKIPRLIRRVIDRGGLQGTAWAYVYNEDDFIGGRYYGEYNSKNMMYKGRIRVKRFPNTNFFPDPDAYSIEEAKFVETTEVVSLDVVKNNPAFRDYAGADKLESLLGPQVEMDSDATGEIFDRDNYPSQNSQQVRGDENVTLHTHWERYINDDGKWQLDVTYYLRDTSFELLRIEDVKPNIYPFVPYYDEEEEQDIWGTSACMDILENQKIINKTSQTASIIGVLHQNPQKTVLRESGINAAEMARTGTMPGKVWQTNVPKAIEIIQPPDIPKGLFELEDRMKNDIKEMVGVNEAYTGNSVGSLTTSTGVNDLIERATIRDKDKSTNIDEFVERLSDLIVRFILVYWTEKRPIVTRQPNGNPQFGTWKPIKNKITLDNLEWRVKSEVYAHAPMTQAAKRQQADKLMQMQGQFQFNPPIITPEEWIRFQDFDMKEEILQRMQADRDKLQSQETNNLTQQIMQLIDQSNQMAAQGIAAPMIHQQLQGAVQQILQQTQSTGASQSQEGAAQGSAAHDPKGPGGNISPVAMGAMTNG